MTFPERRWVKRRKSVQYRRQLRAAVAACKSGKLPAARLAASVQGWLAHVRYGNTTGLRQSILQKIPAEVLTLIKL